MPQVQTVARVNGHDVRLTVDSAGASAADLEALARWTRDLENKLRGEVPAPAVEPAAPTFPALRTVRSQYVHLAAVVDRIEVAACRGTPLGGRFDQHIEPEPFENITCPKCRGIVERRVS